MEFVRGIHNLKSYHRCCALLTIGNFDGFHRGHRLLIVKLQKIGCDRGLSVIMVMIFELQLREYFLESVRLSSFRDKFSYFSNLGIDILLCVLFNSQFSLFNLYSFVSNIFIRLICVGDHFVLELFVKEMLIFLKKMSGRFWF